VCISIISGNRKMGIIVRLANKRVGWDKEVDQSEESTLKPYRAQMNT